MKILSAISNLTASPICYSSTRPKPENEIIKSSAFRRLLLPQGLRVKDDLYGEEEGNGASVTLKQTQCWWQCVSREAGWNMTHTIFDKATRSLGTIRVMSKVALMAGSSQHGKARRASVAWERERHTQRRRERDWQWVPDVQAGTFMWTESDNYKQELKWNKSWHYRRAHARTLYCVWTGTLISSFSLPLNLNLSSWFVQWRCSYSLPSKQSYKILDSYSIMCTAE